MIFDGINALKYAKVHKSSETAEDLSMNPENLTKMYPRSQSSDGLPNGAPNLQSCVRFTEFPAYVTYDLGGSVAVDEILVVGNAAEPYNSNNFTVYASMESEVDPFEDVCENSNMFPPSDEDYMQNNTRLGDVAVCGEDSNYKSARYITIKK